MIDKGIQIRNIFYMLSYAFRALQKNNYKYIEKEHFENVDDLLAEILYSGVSYQIKQGLKRDYVEIDDDISTIKGRININESIRLFSKNSDKINCKFDVFSENVLLNQILKSTINVLIKQKTVAKERRNNLKSLQAYFQDVDLIDYYNIDWNAVEFDRNNQNYILLLNICKIVSKNLLMTEKEGRDKHIIFTDNQMQLVFQNFVKIYFQKLIKVNKITNISVTSMHINRAIDYSKYNEGTIYLPDLQTDITIQTDKKTLIIDTKYYESILKEHYGKKRYESDNINQIHEYVRQYNYTHTDKEVQGMLLYAKTDENVEREQAFETGNWYYIRTLDLNVEPFEKLTKQLDDIFNEIVMS